MPVGDLLLIPSRTWDAVLRGLRWQRSFKAVGPGVTFTNTPDGAVLTINPPRPPPQRQRPATDVTVLITEAYAGGGKYNGLILLPPAGTVDKTTDVTAADCGNATGAAECLVVNAQELGTSGHRLTDPANTDQLVYNGRLVGVGADDLPVVVINGQWFDPCE